jgi:phosphatidylserine/phosphatidylglycerophosphate/cardiolipin synthase-like enzyme
MNHEFQVTGTNDAAPFTLKIHRGEGMALLGMNWRQGKPPPEFVGFVIEFREPEGDRFFALTNRLAFPGENGEVSSKTLSTRNSPIQKFRWVHFPRNADLPGKFTYRVTPAFMSPSNDLSYGESQEAALTLSRETYPNRLNVTFTRGFVSSQAFVDRFVTKDHGIRELLPEDADAGLDFEPTHPRAEEALAWMGFEARSAILAVLDEAIADKKAKVRIVAYDLSEKEVVKRLQKLRKRLQIIIDDSDKHGEPGSAESQAATRLRKTAGATNVKRHHMSNLQHNKTIVVEGPKVKAVVCGSTNFTWRGFFVQSNNAVVLRGARAVAPFRTAFENYWQHDNAKGFGGTRSAKWSRLGIKDVNAKVAFSPHVESNALLQAVADDIGKRTTSSLFYSLAFLFQTKGPIRDAIVKVKDRDDRFVYGISDRKAKGDGLDVQKPSGNVVPVFAAALEKNLPLPFKAEPSGLSGGVGTRMHHKFVVIDFDKPSARVYLGSYNFSSPADRKNGENLLLIKDRCIAVSYMIEALRIFDHYHFRVSQKESGRKKLTLLRPPRQPGEKAWWEPYYTDARKARDRQLFS